ncbi:MAG: phage major capsid protein [Pelagibacterium sp.]|uniref:phage major capsid protein n=1 Tax=Pelagibacterium sp. TaxID=1967288 RepID=UPI0032ED746E
MEHVAKSAMLTGALEFKEGDDDDPVSIVTKSLEDLQKAIDARLKKLEEKGDKTDDAELKALQDKVVELEKKANRPGSDKPADDEQAKIESKAFGTYLRLGNAAPVDDLKALTVANDEQGGYLAPAEMSNEFIRDLVEYSPIRSIASVRSISSPSVKYPKRTGITNAQWEGELEESEESTVTFGQLEVPARKLMTYVDISNELLADSGGTAEAEVRLALAEDFGQKEGIAFLSGDGVKRLIASPARRFGACRGNARPGSTRPGPTHPAAVMTATGKGRPKPSSPDPRTSGVHVEPLQQWSCTPDRSANVRTSAWTSPTGSRAASGATQSMPCRNGAHRSLQPWARCSPRQTPRSSLALPLRTRTTISMLLTSQARHGPR